MMFGLNLGQSHCVDIVCKNENKVFKYSNSNNLFNFLAAYQRH